MSVKKFIYYKLYLTYFMMLDQTGLGQVAAHFEALCALNSIFRFV